MNVSSPGTSPDKAQRSIQNGGSAVPNSATRGNRSVRIASHVATSPGGLIALNSSANSVFSPQNGRESIGTTGPVSPFVPYSYDNVQEAFDKLSAQFNQVANMIANLKQDKDVANEKLSLMQNDIKESLGLPDTAVFDLEQVIKLIKDKDLNISIMEEANRSQLAEMRKQTEQNQEKILSHMTEIRQLRENLNTNVALGESERTEQEGRLEKLNIELAKERREKDNLESKVTSIDKKLTDEKKKVLNYKEKTNKYKLQLEVFLNRTDKNIEGVNDTCSALLINAQSELRPPTFNQSGAGNPPLSPRGDQNGGEQSNVPPSSDAKQNGAQNQLGDTLQSQQTSQNGGDQSNLPTNSDATLATDHGSPQANTSGANKQSDIENTAETRRNTLLNRHQNRWDSGPMIQLINELNQSIAENLRKVFIAKGNAANDAKTLVEEFMAEFRISENKDETLESIKKIIMSDSSETNVALDFTNIFKLFDSKGHNDELTTLRDITLKFKKKIKLESGFQIKKGDELNDLIENNPNNTEDIVTYIIDHFIKNTPIAKASVMN